MAQDFGREDETGHAQGAAVEDAGDRHQLDPGGHVFDGGHALAGLLHEQRDGLDHVGVSRIQLKDCREVLRERTHQRLVLQELLQQPSPLCMLALDSCEDEVVHILFGAPQAAPKAEQSPRQSPYLLRVHRPVDPSGEGALIPVEQGLHLEVLEVDVLHVRRGPGVQGLGALGRAEDAGGEQQVEDLGRSADTIKIRLRQT